MKKKITRVFSLWLACLMLLFCPLSAYAGVQSPSDANHADEEPFYYDENGNKVYDSDIDWSQYRSEPNYDDIMWTFEEYPETMMANGDTDTYIVGVDDAVVVAVIGAACAACGVAIARSDIPEFVSKGFEPWLRRNKGTDTATMNMWQSLFKTTVGTSFVGMKLLSENVKEFLGLSTHGATSVNIPTASILRDTPFFDSTSVDRFVAFATLTLASGTVRYYDIVSSYSLSDCPEQCAYLMPASVEGIYYFKFMRRRSDASSGYADDYGYMYYNNYLPAGYFEYNKPRQVNTITGGYYKDMFTYFNVPVFISQSAAYSYLFYGTTGGLVNEQHFTGTLTVNTANQWTDLKQDFLTRWAVSDTFNIPATQDALDTLVDSLSKSQTGADVITNLNKVWAITDNNGGGDIVVSPSAAYSSLCYVLSALAGYVGATLTDEQKDSFITSFYTGNVDGTAALVDEQAQAIVRNFVVINGGSQSPDDNNDNNKYKVLKKLAVSLGAFLVSAGLVSDAPDFDNQPAVSGNVQVVEKQSPDVPTPNPDTGTDLSGILGYLKQFLDILLAWANPLSLIDSLVSKLELPTISDGIKSAIKTLPKLISGELTLPELFGNVTDAIFSMPQQVADAIAHALGMEDGFPDILGGIEHVGDVIISIPGQITAFFSVDMAAVGNSLGGVQTALSSRFDAVISVTKIFDGLSFRGDETIPVITMRVPDTIAEVIGQNEVIVFDLRGYESYCRLIRNVFRCFMWIGFAFAVARMFDIEFHVG